MRDARKWLCGLLVALMALMGPLLSRVAVVQAAELSSSAADVEVSDADRVGAGFLNVAYTPGKAIVCGLGTVASTVLMHHHAGQRLPRRGRHLQGRLRRHLDPDARARGGQDSSQGRDRVSTIPFRRAAVPALFLLLLAGFAAGIWGTYRAAFPGPGLYRVTGIFEARGGPTLLLVRHDKVPGFMDEMESMALFAESTALLDGADLRRGDRVRLTVRQEPGRLVAVEIQKIR